MMKRKGNIRGRKGCEFYFLKRKGYLLEKKKQKQKDTGNTTQREGKRWGARKGQDQVHRPTSST